MPLSLYLPTTMGERGFTVRRRKVWSVVPCIGSGSVSIAWTVKDAFDRLSAISSVADLKSPLIKFSAACGRWKVISRDTSGRSSSILSEFMMNEHCS